MRGFSFTRYRDDLYARFRETRLSIEKYFYLDDKNPDLEKVKISHNKPLSKKQFRAIEKICDIFTAIVSAVPDKVIPPAGGIFWGDAVVGRGAFDLFLRKNKYEIEHSFLFNTRFRDFPSLAYEMDELTPTPDFWVRRYIRLSNVLPKKWRVKTPAMFGEIGWKIRGGPVNRLTSINQERISAMYMNGVIQYLEQQKFPKIMEIGAGSGELGYAICKALPRCTWFDCDLLLSLFYSVIHQLVFLPNKRHVIYVGDIDLPAGLDERFIIRSAKKAAELKNAVVNIPNFLIRDFVGHLNLHMAYNTYSFGEMPKNAVEEYADVLSGFLKEHGVLFEQNGYHVGLNDHDFEVALTAKFGKQTWDTSNPWLPILNGTMRTWSNNLITNKLSENVRPETYQKVLDSLNDNNDAIDIEWKHEAWEKLYELFPM
jgi:hypothetical protein